jgi:hypothetical protein
MSTGLGGTKLVFCCIPDPSSYWPARPEVVAGAWRRPARTRPPGYWSTPVSSTTPPGQYLDVISSFLEEGLKAGEPALVAVPHGNLELIRARLGDSSGTVRFRDMSVLGRNPSRIIPAVRRFADAHRGVRTRFAGEPLWAGRSPAEIEEATRHEAARQRGVR